MNTTNREEKPLSEYFEARPKSEWLEKLKEFNEKYLEWEKYKAQFEKENYEMIYEYQLGLERRKEESWTKFEQYLSGINKNRKEKISFHQYWAEPMKGIITKLETLNTKAEKKKKTKTVKWSKKKSRLNLKVKK